MFRPRTTLQLVLGGMLIVVTPLVAGIVFGVHQVRQLTTESTRAVYQSGQVMEISRRVREQTAEIERTARQYLVLKDADLLEVLDGRTAMLQVALGELSSARGSAGPVMTGRLERLLDDLEEWLHRAPDSISGEDPETAMFDELRAVATEISYDTVGWMTTRSGEIRARAARIEHLVGWQLAVVLVTTAVLTAVLIVLITRPLRQIDRHITRMADGELGKPVSVGGPNDLRSLGERLDYLRRRLVELESEKVSFLRQVSHELKTPLSAIREGSQLFRDGVVGELSAEQNEVSGIIHANSLRLQALIEDLLRYSTRRATSPLDDAALVNLDELIADVLERQTLAVASKDLELERRLERRAVLGDREQLRVVVENLVSNAVKYTPAGGVVSVSLGGAGRETVLDVIDSGPGVPESETERIFELFYQGKSSPEGLVGGTGLGLAIAKEFVLQHRGEIICLPSPRGAHFRVKLPRAEVARGDE